MLYAYNNYRSKDFRPSFSHLAELRALFPQGTPFMALTATATERVRNEVMRELEMVKCVKVSMSPDRPNICYEVCTRTTIDTDLSWLLSSLREKLQNTPRVLVFNLQ